MKYLRLCAALIFFSATAVFLAEAVQFQDEFVSEIALPNLSVRSVTFLSRPKVGSHVGQITVMVENKGQGNAEMSQLKLNCQVTDCADEQACQRVVEAINGVIAVPPLETGAATTLNWIPPLSVKWAKGTYTITAEVDAGQFLQEADETDNLTTVSTFVETVSPADK